MVFSFMVRFRMPPAFMREHGILVSPCFSGGGMRVKIIEAMTQGKPVVTTSIGAEGLGTVHGKNILIGRFRPLNLWIILTVC